MSDISERATQFRALHHQPGAFVIPNPWDVGSARILVALGFKALATTSAGHAFSLGLADGGVSRQAALDHCRQLVEASNLPVSADLEKGFGDTPEDVAATVRAAAETGLAGCSIEDFSGDEADPIYDFGLALDRVRAAVEAARGLGRDFVLTARCENLLHGRLELADTIRRLQAYGEAGADVLYAPGLSDIATIRDVCTAVDKPCNVLTGIPGMGLSVATLAEAGVKRISIGSALARLAYGRVIEAAREMAESGTFGFVDEAASTPAIEKLLTA